MSPGVSRGTVTAPVPPFHQQPKSFTSRFSKTKPIVPLVSFFANAASGVIRQATDRVARRVSPPSAETAIVLSPGASHVIMRGACWTSCSRARASSPAPSGVAAAISIFSRYPYRRTTRSFRSISASTAPVFSTDQSGAKVRPLLVEREIDTRSASVLRTAFTESRPPR
jgi:hypothetical protein